MRDHHQRRLTAAVVVAGAVLAAFMPTLRAGAEPVATRVAGADRYATAAELSKQTFEPGVPVAYLATGLNFPDALTGGAAAAKAGGPVLLTLPGELPPSTSAELDRLNPGKIVVLGGASVVADGVLTAADPFTDGTVSRIAGVDRWSTAASLSAATFPADVHTVYVATGASFPDALAGGPAAAHSPSGGGPLLLVEPTAIPQPIAAELARLSATKVIVLGGSSAVADSVLAALDPYSDEPVTRVAGADRFLTSVGASNSRFSSADKVFLATGRNFPDALAGGAIAGRAHAPMLLTETDCIPPQVNAEITRLNPTSLVVIGGTNVMSNAVLSRAVCLPPTTTTLPPTATTAPPQACHPNYSKCLNPGSSDYDCAGGSGNGPDYVDGPFNVIGADPYGLDSDNDGIACEA